MNDQLFRMPADPNKLTDRQRAALEIVRTFGQPIRPMEAGAIIHVHHAEYPWNVCTTCFRDGLSVLRELHRKGLVRRVGRGGGRWTLSELPGKSTDPHTRGTSGRYDPETAEIPY